MSEALSLSPGTMTNAYPHSRAAWASYMLLHNRIVAADESNPHAQYGLSYDRTLFERYGRFSEDLRAGEDTEFNARLTPHHAIVKPPAVRTAHRYPTTVGGLLRDAFRRGQLHGDDARPHRARADRAAQEPARRRAGDLERPARASFCLEPAEATRPTAQLLIRW